MDRAGVVEHGRRLVAGLRGRVVEVGVGNGRMFPHCPAGRTARPRRRHPPLTPRGARRGGPHEGGQLTVIVPSVDRTQETVRAAVVAAPLRQVPSTRWPAALGCQDSWQVWKYVPQALAIRWMSSLS